MYIRGRDRMVVGCWSYNYLCKQCLSPLMLWVRISISARCTTLCDKVCQWLATGQWFFPGSSVSSTDKTDRHDIAEILFKVALNTIKQTNKHKCTKGFGNKTKSYINLLLNNNRSLSLTRSSIVNDMSILFSVRPWTLIPMKIDLITVILKGDENDKFSFWQHLL